MTRPWIRTHYALGTQKVRVELPAGVNVNRIQLLRAETDIPVRQNGQVIEFAIPSVQDYEVAALYRA